tara:strand:- start:6382 stop:6723 length:342 start_codon:yes stop_codon:yes gene_type:complete
MLFIVSPSTAQQKLTEFKPTVVSLDSNFSALDIGFPFINKDNNIEMKYISFIDLSIKSDSHNFVIENIEALSGVTQHALFSVLIQEDIKSNIFIVLENTDLIDQVYLDRMICI